MKSNKLLILILFFAGSSVIFVIFYLINKQNHILGVISPLATEEETKEYKTVFDKKTTQNYPPNQHFPKNLEPSYIDELDIKASSYAVMDRGSNELLISKNLTQELPIASVTKIMTAIVSLENTDLDLELKVSSVAATLGEATMGLTAGEIVTVNELLYGMMLPSGNDAAETLAEGLQGGKSNFVLTMNKKALDLGLFDTYFFNTTGLDGDTREKTSFSTALDLLALTNYALSNSKFAEIVATNYIEFPYKEGQHKDFYLSNILQLNRSYPGIKGVKPGITDFAGETLVSYAENGRKQIIVVLLGTQNSKDEVVKIYDYIFGKLGIRVR